MNDRNLERPARAMGDETGAVTARPLRELEELALTLLVADTTVGVLKRVVYAANFLIPHADVVSITVRRDEDAYFTSAATDSVAAELDELQYANREGPCLDAANPDGPAYAHSGDLASDPSWPRFGPKAAERGFSSLLSTALLVRPEPEPFTGALNIYAREPHRLDASARDMAFVLATYASFAVSVAQDRGECDEALARVRSEAANLRKALESRTVIGQATGILMARRGLTADEAFEVLSQASQNHNVKLAGLARILADHPETADRI